MKTTFRWLNDYLDPPASAQEQAELLTAAGFPLESSEPVGNGDVRQDFETTTNRGDCLSHIGLAREVAARSGRTLRIPAAAPQGRGPRAATLIQVRNHEPERCPLYTARIIRGVTVGPSPDWLQRRLVARGDIPRNNIVDATNFVLFELGQPTHVFDLARLEGAVINVRMAREGEPFLPIGEDAKEVRLSRDDLVIADAHSAVAMAGVKGGAGSAVSDSTTDILLEAAAFDPVSVRRSSRRHGITSDSSYRFERGVHPGQVNAAAERLAALILELAGGELAEGVVADGAPLPAPRRLTLRPERVRWIMGVPIENERMVAALRGLGFEVERAGEVLHCTVPQQRLDIEREIDLIEEVGRIFGHDNVPVTDSIEVRVAAPQPRERARRAVSDALVGLGFVETITHSLVAESAAGMFLMPAQHPLRLRGEQAGAEPVLRPSILPSLLRVRAYNRHQGVADLRLFELAATFWRDREAHHEEQSLALLADQTDPALGLRPLRGAVEQVARVLLGRDAIVEARPEAGVPWFAPGALILADGCRFGRMGLLAPAILRGFDLTQPCLAAELDVERHFTSFPPDAEARALPGFPSIERDVSAILDDEVTWAEVRAAVTALALDLIEQVEFVTVYRGRQIGAGRKSLTLRCRFRAPDRTLTHDEVDPQMSRLMAALKRQFAAEIRE